jgi:hypothetical protein
MRVPDASGTCRTFRFGNAQMSRQGPKDNNPRTSVWGFGPERRVRPGRDGRNGTATSRLHANRPRSIVPAGTVRQKTHNHPTLKCGAIIPLSLGDDEFFKNANPVLRTGLLSLSPSGTSPHRKSRSSVSFTRLGFAFPLEAFITWPFRKLMAAAFPAR